MVNDTFLLRHEKKHDSYINQVIKKQNIVNVVNENPLNMDIPLISEKIIKKQLFAFMIMNNQNIIGAICICNNDWENRNGLLKIGIKNEYYNFDYVKDLTNHIHTVLLFCGNDLRLKRLWGMCDTNDSLSLKVLEPFFKIEGNTLIGNKLYLGCILF